MFNRIRNTISIAGMTWVFLAIGTGVANAEVPNIFTAGTPAEAAKVNQNFEHNDGRISVLEARHVRTADSNVQSIAGARVLQPGQNAVVTVQRSGGGAGLAYVEVSAAVLAKPGATPAMRVAKHIVGVRATNATNLAFDNPTTIGTTGLIEVTDDASGNLEVRILRQDGGSDSVNRWAFWEIKIISVGDSTWELLAVAP